MRFAVKTGSKIQHNAFADQAYVIMKTDYQETPPPETVIDKGVSRTIVYGPRMIRKGDFYSFDDDIVIQTKTDFAKSCGYGGVFTWSFDGNRDGRLLKIMSTIKE